MLWINMKVKYENIEELELGKKNKTKLLHNAVSIELRICWLSPAKEQETPWKVSCPSAQESLDCIWWWGSRSRDFRNIEYSFIVITPRFTPTWNGSTC